MKLAVTGKNQAAEGAPRVLRGSTEYIISKAAEIGYDAVELDIKDAEKIDRKELRRLLHENGITLSSIATGFAYTEDHLSLSSEEPQIRAAAIARMRGYIRLAEEYGAVVIIGLLKGLVRDASSRQACMDHLTASLRELLPYAREHHVVMVLEIINRYESDFLTTIAEGMAFLQNFDTEYLKMHIDTYHMNIEEPDPVESIRKAGGLIGHCHIADSDRWYAGHGHYDFAATIHALREIGYEGALAVESLMYPAPEESAKQSYQTLKALCGE